MKLTYIPPENESSAIGWGGRRWKANVPQEVSEDDGYTIMESVREKNPDGTMVLISRERKVSLIEMARGNPMFQVGDEIKQTRRRLSHEDVETAAQYREYAEQWFKDETDAKSFKERWEDEEGMRERAGVSDDDVSFLRPHLKNRLHELEQAAMTERMQARMSR